MDTGTIEENVERIISSYQPTSFYTDHDLPNRYVFVYTYIRYNGRLMNPQQSIYHRVASVALRTQIDALLLIVLSFIDIG